VRTVPSLTLRRVARACAVVAALAVAAPALAQSASDSTARRQLADRVVAEVYPDSALEAIASIKLPGMAQMETTTPGASALMKAMGSFLSKYMSTGAVRDTIVAFYVDSYTTSELSALHAWHTSALGRKERATNPALGLRIQRMVTSVLAAHADEFQEVVMSAMRASVP
jgi:hypothetical protein